MANISLRNLTTIYIFDEDRVLLMHKLHSRVFTGAIWSGIGGHFEPSELNEPTTCVLRELHEETGIAPEDVTNLKLRYVTTRLAQDELRQQYIFFADLARPVEIVPCEEGEVSWVPLVTLFDRQMSLTNELCLRHYFQSGRSSDAIFVGAVGMKDDRLHMEFVPLHVYGTSY